MRRPILISLFLIFGCTLSGLASAEYQDYYFESEEQLLKNPSVMQTFSKKSLEIFASMIQSIAPTYSSEADYIQQFSDSSYLMQENVPSSGFHFEATTIDNDATGIGLHYYFH